MMPFMSGKRELNTSITYNSTNYEVCMLCYYLKYFKIKNELIEFRIKKKMRKA